MKKKLLLSLIIIILFFLVKANSTINDWSASGWSSSTGFDQMYGKAEDVRKIPGGYSFRCAIGGICYTINGGSLTIGGDINGVGGPISIIAVP